MTFQSAIALATLQEKKRHVATIAGHKILFIWHDNTVHAIQSQCPHLKLPLAKGTITDNCTIVCPFHKSEFDLKTGETQCWSTWPPVVGAVLGKLSKEKSLRVYHTQIDNGMIQVDLGS